MLQMPPRESLLEHSGRLKATILCNETNVFINYRNTIFRTFMSELLFPSKGPCSYWSWFCVPIFRRPCKTVHLSRRVFWESPRPPSDTSGMAGCRLFHYCVEIFLAIGCTRGCFEAVVPIF